MHKKEPVTAPFLGMKVFHDNIYDGKEPMEIVGIRKTQVELEGDYSGGTHNVTQKEWFPIEGTFRLRKICSEHIDGKTCPLPNIHCSYPECEPYLPK